MTARSAPDRLLSVLAAFDHAHPALSLTDISRLGRADPHHGALAGERPDRVGRAGAGRVRDVPRGAAAVGGRGAGPARPGSAPGRVAISGGSLRGHPRERAAGGPGRLRGRLHGVAVGAFRGRCPHPGGCPLAAARHRGRSRPAGAQPARGARGVLRGPVGGLHRPHPHRSGAVAPGAGRSTAHRCGGEQSSGHRRRPVGGRRGARSGRRGGRGRVGRRALRRRPGPGPGAAWSGSRPGASHGPSAGSRADLRAAGGPPGHGRTRRGPGRGGRGGGRGGAGRGHRVPRGGRRFPRRTGAGACSAGR